MRRRRFYYLAASFFEAGRYSTYSASAIGRFGGGSVVVASRRFVSAEPGFINPKT
jgi:hypothetical protein